MWLLCIIPSWAYTCNSNTDTRMIAHKSVHAQTRNLFPQKYKNKNSSFNAQAPLATTHHLLCFGLSPRGCLFVPGGVDFKGFENFFLTSLVPHGQNPHRDHSRGRWNNISSKGRYCKSSLRGHTEGWYSIWFKPPARWVVLLYKQCMTEIYILKNASTMRVILLQSIFVAFLLWCYISIGISLR